MNEYLIWTYFGESLALDECITLFYITSSSSSSVTLRPMQGPGRPHNSRHFSILLSSSIFQLPCPQITLNTIRPTIHLNFGLPTIRLPLGLSSHIHLIALSVAILLMWPSHCVLLLFIVEVVSGALDMLLLGLRSLFIYFGPYVLRKTCW
jgi:hypothetical protein